MNDQPKRRWYRRLTWQSWALVVIGFLFVVWFAAWGPMKLMTLPANPKFCASCHNMQMEYDTWHTSKHSGLICGDCHIPPQFFKGLVWDAYFGARDFYKFYGVGKWDEPLLAQPHSWEFVQENCIRCHEYRAHSSISDDRNCWDCHREMYHRQQLWAEEQTQRRIDDPR